ncbi:MAG TPA: hypothetical protein VGP06_07175, partial [Janthinobacterium sp.]|nr:hypothetical protein [Janthinobacterium sp.]
GRVTDIMSEISAATQEQTLGIEQINQAICQMDEVTQQNAALVEQAAATAASMQEQAGGLAGLVSLFRLGAAAPAPAPVLAAAAKLALQRPTPRQGAAKRPQTELASAEWETF